MSTTPEAHQPEAQAPTATHPGHQLARDLHAIHSRREGARIREGLTPDTGAALWATRYIQDTACLLRYAGHEAWIDPPSGTCDQSGCLNLLVHAVGHGCIGTEEAAQARAAFDAPLYEHRPSTTPRNGYLMAYDHEWQRVCWWKMQPSPETGEPRSLHEAIRDAAENPPSFDRLYAEVHSSRVPYTEEEMGTATAEPVD